MKFIRQLLLAIAFVPAAILASPDATIRNYRIQCNELKAAVAEVSHEADSEQRGIVLAQLLRFSRELGENLDVLGEQIFAMQHVPVNVHNSLKIHHAALVKDARDLYYEIARIRAASPSLRPPTPIKLTIIGPAEPAAF